jgi:hypothetical protein
VHVVRKLLTRAALAVVAAVAIPFSAAAAAGGSYPYSHQTSFHDITEGSNLTPDTACGYLCTAEPGYDGPTGLGTPNGIGGF